MELLGAYSNPDLATKFRAILAGQNADCLPGRSRSIVSRKAPNQAQKRLRGDEVAALVAAYRAGSTLQEVASAFGVHTQTAGAHLERNGLPRQQRGLTAEQVGAVMRDNAARVIPA